MPKTKISEYSATANSNTDVASINIDEGCAPSGINNAIRAIMGHLKDFQSGTSNDPFTVGSSGSLTLSYGTANGVAYLNGSKVVTTGSALTFDGTNLGIGTSSPGSFAAAGRNLVVGTGTGNNGLTIYSGNSSGGNIYFADGTTGAETYAGFIQYAHSTNVMLFGVNNTGSEAMTLDSSGNLGLGVTPSAWASFKSVDVITGGAGLTSSGQNCYLTANAYYNSGWKYKITTIYGVSWYEQFNGQHAWFSAPSGTAGNAITFTQAMTLTAAGDLGVGTTSPVSRLEIKKTTDNTALTVTSSYEASLQLVNGGGSEVSVINAGGSNILSLRTANTERARIDSSGRLLLGTTSAVGQLTIVTSPTATARSVSYSATGGTIDYYIVNGSNTGSISTNTTTTSYVTSSDYRLKNSIAPMTGALAKVAQLKPVTYKWNTDGSDGEGFIAHELAEVVPQCVTGAKDAVDADGKPVYQGIDTSFLVATLTAAIQEQQALITQLTARITALEGA